MPHFSITTPPAFHYCIIIMIVTPNMYIAASVLYTLCSFIVYVVMWWTLISFPLSLHLSPLYNIIVLSVSLSPPLSGLLIFIALHLYYCDFTSRLSNNNWYWWNVKIATLPLHKWGGWGWYINGRMLVSGRSLARLRLTVLFYLCEFQPPAWKNGSVGERLASRGGISAGKEICKRSRGLIEQNWWV